MFYAAKKTRKTMTVSFSALEGAACMNNTFCLCIFMGLIYIRGLAWQYTAETASIVIVRIRRCSVHEQHFLPLYFHGTHIHSWVGVAIHCRDCLHCNCPVHYCIFGTEEGDDNRSGTRSTSNFPSIVDLCCWTKIFWS